MISIELITPYEMLKKIAEKARAKRLALNLSQKTLSEKSGVSHGVLKKFERTGKISLESLLRLALILDALGEFKGLFAPMDPTQYLSLDELMKETDRQRGRK